jgi:hypothetical protein
VPPPQGARVGHVFQIANREKTIEAAITASGTNPQPGDFVIWRSQARVFLMSPTGPQPVGDLRSDGSVAMKAPLRFEGHAAQDAVIDNGNF